MHQSIFTLAVLVLPNALALPSSGHGHNHHHHHDYEAYKSGHVSQAASASGASAPFGLGNSTVGVAGSTGSGGPTYKTLTIQSTIYETAHASESAAPSEAASAASGAGSCAPAVTVTHNPTTTVTVTGGAAPVESNAASSAPVVSVKKSSPPIVASSVAPVTHAPSESSTANPIGLAPNPVPKSSTKPAPALSSTPVATQAATSAPTVSSATPVETSPAAPAQSATSSAANTPSNGGSPVANADYCANTSPPDCMKSGDQACHPHWTGQNYAGGIAGQKRGIVYVDNTTPNITGLMNYANESSGIHWLGNYYSGSATLASHVEFVPQMYGLQSTNDWNKNADNDVKNGAKHFLSFGEPGTPNDKLYQTPSGAASFYKQYMEPYTAKGIKIGAPGCLGGPQDWKWDESFLCESQKLGLHVDFIAGHWFDQAAPTQHSFDAFKQTVEDYINVARGKPVWIDNVWAQGSIEDQKAFMDLAIPYLESNAAIERYGWVPQDSPSGTGFVNDAGEIQEMGTFFANHGN